MYTSLEIMGLRGFSKRQVINFAQPNGQPGSGLTILVGANNAGKSTAVEALRAIAQRSGVSLTQGRRNKAAGDTVELILNKADGSSSKLESVRPGTSETRRVPETGMWGEDLLVLPSRRVFNPYFGKGILSRREHYMQSIGFPVMRSSTLEEITQRLFSVQDDPTRFNDVMRQVLDPPPNWTIDQNDSGQFFLKLTRGDATHTSEGLGEGIVSLIYLVDALHDSLDGQLIAIDEPELSLHPALQRKVARLLSEYASTRQIILATHSPYFVNLEALANGAKIARIHIEGNSTAVSELTETTAKRISQLLADRNNPHVFGLNAQEVFFLDDGIILVEGQEDVIYLELVEANIGLPLVGEVFGWGVGGADKMELIAQILHELGFRSVVGILDGNKADLIETLQDRFPSYHFVSLPANDIRTKSARKARPAVAGLLDETNTSVRHEHLDATKRLIESVNEYLSV